VEGGLGHECCRVKQVKVAGAKQLLSKSGLSMQTTSSNFIKSAGSSSGLLY
jgi:hypothetical protein